MSRSVGERAHWSCRAWRSPAGVPGAAQAAINFAAPVNITVGSSPQDVVTGNFNGDADPDLAVVNQSSNNVTVLLGGRRGLRGPGDLPGRDHAAVGRRPATSTGTRTRTWR